MFKIKLYGEITLIKIFVFMTFLLGDGAFSQTVKKKTEPSLKLKQSGEETTESASELLDDLRHGLMNIGDVKNQLPISDGQFYLCGPTGFMGFIKRQLMEVGVAEDRIFYEVFGPHSDL